MQGKTAVTSVKRYRKPNALKHGGFSGGELLPWEDPSEFEELRRSLMEEHQPEGPLQAECVNTIASYIWRKRRVRDKRNFDTAAALERVENRELWKHPPPLFDTSEERSIHALREMLGSPRTKPCDDYEQLLRFSGSLYGDFKDRFLEFNIGMLPSEFSAHLREKVLSQHFESTADRIVAVKKEVDTVLLPMVRNRAPDRNAYFETAAAFLTGDRVIEDLDVEERLDAGIDRALKRLWQLKMARQLDQSRQPKLIESKPSNQLKGPDDTAPRTKK
jgi:hypothetical protein